MRNSTKTLAFAVDFAFFVNRNGLDIADAAEIVRLANRVFVTGERSCSVNTESADEAYHLSIKHLKKKAASLGFHVQIPGLWPNLIKDGVEVRIPSQS